MMKTKKNWISCLLILCMMVTELPRRSVMIGAEDYTDDEENSVVISEEESQESFEEEENDEIIEVIEEDTSEEELEQPPIEETPPVEEDVASDEEEPPQEEEREEAEAEAEVENEEGEEEKEEATVSEEKFAEEENTEEEILFEEEISGELEEAFEENGEEVSVELEESPEKMEVTYVKSLKEITVTATFLEGTFIDEVELIVKPLASSSKEYKEAEEALIEEGVEFDGMLAYDIFFKSVNSGEEIQPDERVNISLTLNENAFKKVDTEDIQLDSLQIQHISKDNIEQVASPSFGEMNIVTEKDEFKGLDATFDVNGFSTFTITWQNETKKAVVHWGTMENGSFKEFDASLLDTSVGSVSLRTAYSGYEYVDAVYYAEEPSSISVDTSETISGRIFINDIVTKVTGDNSYSWKAEDSLNNAETFTLADGSHIYVIYQKSESVQFDPTPSDSTGKIPTPTTEKTVIDNGDGTYTIDLEITGAEITESTQSGANVVVVFDNSGSMSASVGSGMTRLQAAKKAVETLVSALNPGTNDIDMALVYFASKATKQQFSGSYWTKNGSNLTNAVNALSTNAGGTNWDQALQYAKEVADTGDDDPTYIIFVTDGCPSVNAHSSHSHGSSGTNNRSDDCYTYALTNAKAVVNAKYYLYGIYTGTDDTNLLDYLISEAKGVSSITATSADAISAAFSNIAQTIVNNLGANEVSTTDGIPTLASVSASVSGQAGGYEYYRKGGKNADGSEKYSSTANGGLGEKWSDAPGASYSESVGVTWDLSAAGAIEADVTYVLRFTIWPSQEAYDLIADLNNGLISYDGLSQEIKNQIFESNGVYSMKTNTSLDTSYSFKGKTYSDSIDFAQGAMDLDVSTIRIEKVWNNALDERASNAVTLILTKDGVAYKNIEVSSDNEWKAEDIYISLGLMTVDSEGNVTVKEPGHDYSVIEPANYAYYWELTADVYRPMVINGTPTMLIKVDSADDADYTINGSYYKATESNALLTAVNDRRSNLNLTKVVSGEGAPEDAEFTYSIVINDANGDDLWFSVQENEETVIDIETNAAAEERNGEKTGYYYIASGSTLTLKIKAGQNVRFINLPSGTTYSITETGMPDGFAFVSVDGSDTASAAVATGSIAQANTKYTVTYTNKYETVNIPVTKTWSDGNNQDGLRPASITVHLYANGTEVDSVKVEPDAEGSWNYTFKNLPKYSNGEEIEYTITEEAVNGYTSEVDDFNITNSHTPAVVEVKVTKVWDDNNNADEERPDSILVQLYGNQVAQQDPVELSESNSWSYTWENLAKNSDGLPITYSVKEVEVKNGYIVNVTDIEDGEITVTNIKVISLTVSKVWEDNNNQDGVRPASITVHLFADGSEIEEVSVRPDEEGSWSYTFENLRKYNGSDEIVYTVGEDEVDNYTTVINGNTITNTHTPEQTSVSGSKTWEDNDNQDGKRPSSITVNLLADGKVIATKTVTAEDGWAWEFTDLDKYRDQGVEIVYTITEDEVDGYTGEVNGFDVTNSHTIEKTEVSGSKTWDDNDDQDGKRPQSITVELYANGTKVDTQTVTAENGWAYSFTGLDKYADGAEIVYTVSEAAVESYDLSVDGYNLTNTHTPEETSISGSKIWVDNSNQDGKRPSSITVNLLANGEKVDSKTVTEEDGWTWSFEGLPKYENGKEIEYTITEDEVDGYTSEINGFNVTNTHEAEKTSVSGSKTWDDEDNQDGIRPRSITVILLADGEEVARKTVTAEDDWAWEFTDLDKYADGEEISYSFSEAEVDGYTITVDNQIITNSHTPEQTSVSGSKSWEDNNNQDGKRPQSITVNLLADGKVIATKTVTAEDGWAWEFTDLDKYRDQGEEIVYTITEDEVDGYTSEVDGFNVTNSHEIEKTEVRGVKVWEDNDDQDGKRPQSITVILLANGKEADRKEVTAEGDWSYAFAGLDKYLEGKEIVYTVEEVAVDNYTTEISGTTITNSHEIEKTSVSGSKVWEDNDNQDGKRPESITVNLLADGEKVDSAIVTAAEEWAWEFTDLDVYKDGKEITYTVSEETVEGYTASIDGFNITNSHEIEKTSLSGEKIWDDADNQDGKRPSSITVNLLADGEKVGSAVVTEAEEWKWEFTDLDVYKEGKKITYTVSEEAVEGYTASIEGTVITNTHTPEKVSVSGQKVWNDADDQDGKRPDSITVLLKADGEIVNRQKVTEDNNWEYSFDNLDKYSNGKEIVYSVEEESVEGYTTVIEGTLITNTHTPEKTEIAGQKIWDDADDQDGKRPENITVNLLADGEKVESIEVTEADEWKWQFTGLDKYKAGKEIAYSFSEEAVEGYTASIEGTTVTNTYIPETTIVEGEKFWDDADDQDGLRPESITVVLLADGKEVAEQEISAESEWKFRFENLPKYRDHGVEIEYSIEEISVEGYETAIDGFAITNTHTPETTEITVEKIWEDAENQDGLRPEMIKVTLLADDEEVETEELREDEEGNWSFTFTELPVYRDHGEEIVYSITEAEVEGYDSEISDMEEVLDEGGNVRGYTVSVVNTHEVFLTEVSVTKVWEDFDDYYGFRPEEIEVILLANGEEVEDAKAVLNEENEWMFTWTDLDLNKEGEAIEYTVEEVKVDRYISEASETEMSEDEEGNITYSIELTNKLKLADLKVVKSIDQYLDSGENLTFIFQVSIHNKEGELTYSNYIGVTLENGQLTNSGMLYQIPYDEELDTISIEEVYTAGYQLSSISSPVITADEEGNVLIEIQAENRFNEEEIIYGSGIINNYKEGSYTEDPSSIKENEEKGGE